ncbi:MAG: adenylate/guanylate cyclase domain-containing protein [Thermodesulfovibrionales bacterium]
MMSAESLKRIRISVALAFVSFTAALVLFVSGLLDGFELKAFDLFSRKLNPDIRSGDIVIVAIDQKSIDSLAAQGVTWPWPRQVYAPIFEHLSEADAVFVDMLFTEPSSYGVEDDTLMAAAMRQAGNVHLPVFLTDRTEGLTPAERAFLERISVSSGAIPPAAHRSALLPLDLFVNETAGGGNVMIRPDEDGVYRSVPLVFSASGITVPHFVLGWLMKTGTVRIEGGTLMAGGKALDLSGGRLLLRYSRNPEPFTVVSASDIIQAYLDSSSGKKPGIGREFFKNKKVLIGPTAAGLYDLKPTPVRPLSTGVHIHATALDNLLHGRSFRPVPLAATAGFMLLLSLIITAAVFRFHSVASILGVLCATAAVSAGLCGFLFSRGCYMPVIYPFLSVALGFMIAAAYNYAVEGRQRRFIKRTFAQYMDHSIVEHILKHPEIIRPGGQSMRVTVLFADIAGFTSIAEKLPPEQTALILHDVLNEFTEVIIRNRGAIDKYIGDAVMAFWGAPISTGDDEANACRASLSCLEALERVNSSFRRRGFDPIRVRIGIHAGAAVVGNLGSDRLFDYTVVGDTVNLASRLEAANKMFGTAIIVSEDVLNATAGRFIARDLGLIEVKGKTHPKRIFELLAEKDKMQDNVAMIPPSYDQAMEAYCKGDLDAACRLFGNCLHEKPGDGPSEFYGRRCRDLIATPAAGRRDVVRMTEK